MINVIILESVDSCIDKDGYIYPFNCDGTPDLMINCHVDDQDDEFSNTIKDDEATRIYQVMEGRLNE